MEKLPTAEEMWDEASNEMSSVDEINHGVPLLMKEFARLHVEAALKAASINAQIKNQFISTYSETLIDKSSILESYPLTNIP
jgi:uncharacterized small protein (DUF1192 family)